MMLHALYAVLMYVNFNPFYIQPISGPMPMGDCQRMAIMDNRQINYGAQGYYMCQLSQ